MADLTNRPWFADGRLCMQPALEQDGTVGQFAAVQRSSCISACLLREASCPPFPLSRAARISLCMTLSMSMSMYVYVCMYVCIQFSFEIIKGRENSVNI